MPSRADSLREYLTGVGADGGPQSDPGLSLGQYRSGTGEGGLGLSLSGTLTGVTVLYASGANPAGAGTLTALDANRLTWQPCGSPIPGPAAYFSGTAVPGLVEGPDPGQFLRVEVTTPLTPAALSVILWPVVGNVFGLSNLDSATALAGVQDYRATVVKNESAAAVTGWRRWLGLLGSPRTTDAAQLGSSGSGTLATTGSLADWPASGWAQVRTSSGTLREVVYYAARTGSSLSVPASGRGLLGTAAAAGSVSDVAYPVPGLAVGLDPAGVQAAGSAIQVVGSPVSAPSGVAWSLAVTPDDGLSVPLVAPGEQFGVWIWRHVPAGLVAAPLAVNKLLTSFNAI